MSEYKVIYHNFDKLEVSYQGAVPAAMLDKLKEAKESAQRENAEQFLQLSDELAVTMRPNGGGGYAYIFSTGETGANVFVQRNSNPANWNLRVAIRSACLATKGLGGAMQHIREICNALGAMGVHRYPDREQEPFDTLVESIARVDYCMDVIANDFMPKRERIIAHSRTGRKFHTPEMDVVERGKLIETVTLGKMPNKQICIYNKSKEIAVKKTVYWHEIWQNALYKKRLNTVSKTVSLNPGTVFKTDLEDSETVFEMVSHTSKTVTKTVLETVKNGSETVKTVSEDDTVWRFEIRVGKHALKDAGITTFQQMQEKLPALFTKILKRTRLAVDEPEGENPNRWEVHPLWKQFQHHAAVCFDDSDADLPQTLVTDLLLEERKIMMEKGILGNLVAYTAMRRMRLDELPDLMQSLPERLGAYIRANPNGLAKKYRDAKVRYADIA